MGEGEVGEGRKGWSHLCDQSLDFRGCARMCHFEGGEVHAVWWHEPKICLISPSQRDPILLGKKVHKLLRYDCWLPAAPLLMVGS